MSVFVWIAIGLLAGLMGNRRRHGDLPADLMLGVAGAVLGGALVHSFGLGGVNGSLLWSAAGAVAGGFGGLLAYQAVRRSP
jgi:uncharacterized membrane protein YeaQ/YmgE (transglycosylase-associated protein family)